MKQQTTHGPSQQGTVARYFHTFLSTLILSFIISFIISMGYSAYYWNKYSYVFITKKTNLEYQHQLNEITKRNNIFAVHYAKLMDRVSFACQKLFNYLANILNNLSLRSHFQSSSTGRSIYSKFTDLTIKVSRLSFSTLENLITKYIGIFTSFWLFVIASLIGGLDGLVSRYIRTVEGGRESTFWFHNGTNIIVKSATFILFAYFVYPFSLNPEIAVCTLALLLFELFKIATSSLKKYL